jgi:hypothetical protein
VALFVVQTTEVVSWIAPDTCAEETRRSADLCPEGCPRCICCARIVPFVTQTIVDALPQELTRGRAPVLFEAPADPGPRGIYHVPKHS